MSLPVRARARFLATFRFVEVRLMETLARWVPTTPEMEVKVLLGQHIWDHAQHADALGKRAHELRAPLHHTLEPAAEWLTLLTELAAIGDTCERLHAYYGIVLEKLEFRYRAYLTATDSLLDAPSVRAVTGILLDISRMRAEHRALIDQLPALTRPEAMSPPFADLAAAAGELIQPGLPAEGGLGRPETSAAGDPARTDPAAPQGSHP